MKGLADIVRDNKPRKLQPFPKPSTKPIKITRPDLVNVSRKGKKVTEEISSPTNSMGVSSTTSGPIQTFDPLMKRKGILRRIKMIVKKSDDRTRRSK